MEIQKYNGLPPAETIAINEGKGVQIVHADSVTPTFNVFLSGEGSKRGELGDICGVAQSTIVNYEKGTRIPYADTAVKMADFFHISIHELLCVDNPELAMAQAKSLDMVRDVSGKKGADRICLAAGMSLHMFSAGTSTNRALKTVMPITDFSNRKSTALPFQGRRKQRTLSPLT